MNLFLRLLVVALKARFKSRLGVFDVCVTHFRAWFTDQDLFRHVTNSRYFSLTDVCVADYLMRTRAWRVLRKRGWVPIIAYEDMIFRRMIRAPHRFAVHTAMLGWTEEAVVIRHVFHRRGSVTAEGVAIARFIDKRGEVVPTADVAAALGHEGPSPALPSYAREALSRARNGYVERTSPAPDPSPSLNAT